MLEKCDECSGEGTQLCMKCDGTGEIGAPCAECGGAGDVPPPPSAPIGALPELCPVCGGGGVEYAWCPSCNGNGAQQCEACNGLGWRKNSSSSYGESTYRSLSDDLRDIQGLSEDAKEELKSGNEVTMRDCSNCTGTTEHIIAEWHTDDQPVYQCLNCGIKYVL